jgi:phosphoribosylaminoimidazole-succinocarboxamide synthase
VLADEVLNPDSSRFWPADEWEPGRPQHALDKQFVRDWSATLDWDRMPPGLEIPAEIVAAAVRLCRLVAAHLTVTLLLALAGVPMPLVAFRVNL